MANDIDKTSPHYKGEFGSIYEVNQKFPSGGVEGDYVAIDGWAHYWNADRGTWCVNAQRDSYWDELITGIINKLKLFKGATYMGVAGVSTVPEKIAGVKMYYFAKAAGRYSGFGGLQLVQGINVLYSDNGTSWVATPLLEVAQELGVSTEKVMSQKAVNTELGKKADKETVNAALDKKADKETVNAALDKKADKETVNAALDKKADKETVNAALDKKADKETVNAALDKKADKETVNAALGKKFDKESVAQESGDSEELVMSQKAVSDKLSDLLKKIEGTHIAVPKTPINGSLKSDGTITTEYGLCHIMLDVSKFRDANITVEQDLTSKQYAFLSSLNDNKVIFINGGGRVDEGIANVKVPKDAVYLYILTGETENPSLPSSISTSYDTKSLQTQINEKQNILTAGNHIVIKDNVVSVDEAIDNLNRQILGYGIEVPQQVTNGSLKSDGTITTEYGLCHIMLDVSDLAEERISVNSSIDPFQYAFLKSFTSTSVVFADGCTRVTGKMEKVTIPQDANYLYILCGDTNSPTLPTAVITSIDNTGLLKETNNILKETRKPFFINSKDEKGNWQYEIYIPTSDNENYIRIPFCHVIDTSINADSWRLYTAFLNDGSKDLYRIVNNGEWEMALQIKGRPDFIGGSQHGDEVVQYMNSFVDGVITETPYSYKGEHNYFNELTFIEKTDLFDPSDNVTKVAEHIKKYTFSKAGVNIKQKIEWLGSYELTYSYLAMLPIERGNSEKQITDRWYDNKTYKVYDVSLPNFRGYPIEMKHGCSAQFICGSTSNINASVEVVYQKPFIENCISFLSDSEYFNKIYFDFCGESYTVNSGDIWESDVNYKLDCSK